MNARFVIGVYLVMLLLLITAGCMQTTPPATPTPTVETITTEVPTPVPTTLSLTPGPTQALPENWNIEIQVQGNGEAINPLITVSCQGGKGLNFIQQIDVKVTRSDGVVKQDAILKPLFKGKEVSLPITSQMGKVNRVEVWATTPQGDKVKIFDDYVPFRTYNP
jgi:glucose/arabinose dehydrogenase